MRKRFEKSVALALCILAISCTVIKEEPITEIYVSDGPEYIYISFGEQEQTKTTYEYGDGHLKVYWKNGDIVCVAPAGRAPYARLYQGEDLGNGTGRFIKVSGQNYTADIYGIYYPGELIKSDIQYNNFDYRGQVQKKENPTSHLSAYHTFMKHVDNVENIDLSDATQSACMRFILNGMTFVKPSRISVIALHNSVPVSRFYRTNCLTSWYSSDGEIRNSPVTVSQLDLGLEGYGSETSLTAYMMMSEEDVLLKAGDVIRVQVATVEGLFYSDMTISSDMTLKGGRCHTLSAGSGWKKGEGDYTEYKYDRESVTIQTGSEGLDLVLMGDGFIAADFDDGTYDRTMKNAADMFFSCQPYSAFKNNFNVYYVKAVSPQRIDAKSTYNGAQNGNATTKFQVSFTPNSTRMDGNTELAIEYAKNALGEDADNRIQNATIIVIANFKCHAGTCYNLGISSQCASDFGQATSVSYFSLGLDDKDMEMTLHHEAGGHGFGKLADEYSSGTNQTFNTSEWYDLQDMQKLGFYRNVDKYIDQNIYEQLEGRMPLTTINNVYWHELFGTKNNYESPEVESLGIFKGAYTYSFGFCRPTMNAANSIMNGNSGIFNAPSRRQIFYRINCLAGYGITNQFGSREELERFLNWDAENTLNTVNSTSNPAIKPNCVEQERLPLAEPVLISGHWDNGLFIKEDRVALSRGSAVLKFCKNQLQGD